MAETAYVAKLPNCDIHKLNKGEEVPAAYDAKTLSGQWANLCGDCFPLHAATLTLGTGKGQRLVVGEPPARDRQAEFNDAAERGDFDAMSEAVGDGDPADFF